MGTTQTTSNPVLDELVRSVRSVLSSERAGGPQARWVAGALRPFLGRPDLLTAEQSQPDRNHYRQHILHVEEDGRFSISALVWLPGQLTPVHDHISWCVVGVHQGREHEASYQVIRDGSERYLLSVGEVTHPAGAVSVLQPPGDIHVVSNPGPELAISIHICGADLGRLGSSIRNLYDLPVVETLPLSFRRQVAKGA